ncbi:MAG: DNRLRE domain-containing protein, partial [Xanthomonadales bacterium]|nr:DNRLRE domain-containing protein [Xanthomonadales bacterium]
MKSIRTFQLLIGAAFGLVVAAGAAVVFSTTSFADTLHVAEDSYIKLDKGNENNGSDKLIQVVDGVNNKDQTGFVKFDFSTLPADLISADVDRATLRMWVEKVDSAGTIEIRQVDDDWDEGSVTGSFPPGYVTFVTARFVDFEDENKFVTVDVTDLFKDWVDGLVDNFGIALVATEGAKVSFGAKETDKV